LTRSGMFAKFGIAVVSVAGISTGVAAVLIRSAVDNVNIDAIRVVIVIMFAVVDDDAAFIGTI